MLKRYSFSCITLLGCIYSISALSNNYDPRLTLWALESSQGIARADLLLPIFNPNNALFFGDIQGKYGERDEDWYASAGLGYRKIWCNQLYGGYFFIDDQETKDNSHYWVASPGIEMMTGCWDARLNGYFPVSDHRKNLGSFFPSGLNDCGIHGDCSFVEFHGHQQFEHRFLRFEEVGNGVDGEVGFRIPYFNCPSLHGGGYYYRIDDKDDVRGVNARADIPLLKGVAFTVEASYDNYEKTKVAAGFKFQWGHNPQCACPSLCDHLYDPVYRYLGPVNRGAPLPVVRGQKDEGLFLRRDNIYFFSNTGTALIAEADAGTFENPLRNDQLTDLTLTFIGPNTNLYFNTGTYTIDAAGDGRITLQDNQSLYGRSADFRCTVSGDDRPILAGGIDIINTSHNTLDSIRLQNILTGPTTVIALNLDNANDVHICNSEIRAQATIPGDNTLTNAAFAITANDSSVEIDNSRITALADIGGDNAAGINIATGIGNFNDEFSNNRFVIRNSVVLGTASVLGTNAFLNFAAGIGTDAINSSAPFLNNSFIIVNSRIGATAFTGENSNNNFATGIGNNGFFSATGGDSSFTGNNFTITNSEISGSSFVGLSSFSVSLLSGIGIGNNLIRNTEGNPITTTMNFTNNIFNIDCSNISGSSTIEVDNSSLAANFGTGIGNNSYSFASISAGINTDNINFTNNIFNILNSTISGSAAVLNLNGGDNFASGIGNKNFAASSDADIVVNSIFSNNNFNIVGSEVNATALTTTNLVRNFATAVGNGFTGTLLVGTGTITTNGNFSANSFNLACDEFNSSALVRGTNSGTNIAYGFGNETFLGVPPAITLNAAFENNIFTMNESIINANAVVSGANSGSNIAIGINADGSGNEIDIFNSIINVLAQVGGTNTGSNNAIGLFVGPGSVIRITDSIVNIAALADGINNAEPTAGTGTVEANNTQFNVIE